MTQHTDLAGPSGYGPKVTVRRSCSDCKACNSESYAVQGDSGHYVYCEHPSLPERKYIGDTRWDTPGWCPAAAPTTQPSPVAQGDELDAEQHEMDARHAAIYRWMLSHVADVLSIFDNWFADEEADTDELHDALAARAAQEGNKP